MAMTWSSLTGSKSTPGSIINWVSYTKLDVNTVVDEAQLLLFESLRVREMRTSWTFGLGIGMCQTALPDRFLDPIGRLYDITNGTWYKHGIETEVLQRRTYDSSLSGGSDLDVDPFTTVSGSSLVNVAFNTPTANGINQGSTITLSGATAVGGLTLNGTFPVVGLPAANIITIDTDTAATSSATGGGVQVTYTANNLVATMPRYWTVCDEQLQFDCALDIDVAFKLLYYRRPPLLSSTNQSNWLTDRYPSIMRVACLAAAAQYMKDNEEFQKHTTMLATLVGSAASSNDMVYRGAEFGTDTPGHGYTGF